MRDLDAKPGDLFQGHLIFFSAQRVGGGAEAEAAPTHLIRRKEMDGGGKRTKLKNWETKRM